MDTLKELAKITEPDPRAQAFAVLDPEAGFRPKTLEDHYHEISSFTLHTGVPLKVREQFEVAKNLLLYSWYVYRFIPVAELHAATCLEFALKIKVDDPSIRGLSKLIKRAIESGWVKNEGFAGYRNIMRMRADQKEIYRQISELSQREFEWYDKPYDYLDTLRCTIPTLRNESAHGSQFLHSGGYGHLEIISEFINQLFQE